MRRWILLGLLLLARAGLPAQQREPAVEAYLLGGGYFHGNLSVAEKWRPQWGAGVLAPLGRRWGAMIDATTSAVEAYWRPDGAPGAGPNDNYAHERRVALSPSLVRLWRRERFSIYAGAGVGFEHERQRNRFREIVGRDDSGRPILAQEYQTNSVSRTDTTLALRVGAIVSLTRRIVFRTDFILLPRYVDESASKSLSAGVGYRF